MTPSMSSSGIRCDVIQLDPADRDGWIPVVMNTLRHTVAPAADRSFRRGRSGQSGYRGSFTYAIVMPV